MFANIEARVPMAKVVKDEANAKAKDVDEEKGRAAPKVVDEARKGKERVIPNFHTAGR